MPVELSTVATFKFAENMLPKLVKRLLTISKVRKAELEQITDTFGDPMRWAAYYIEPSCQQFNPADDDDERRYLVREPLTSRLQHFMGGPRNVGSPHMLVLADSGMGKTSCLVMLKLAHLNAFWPPSYNVVLIKLGPDTLAQLKGLERRKTILLLDALDEDPNAWGRVDDRLAEILSATKNFNRVIITCRTQFFSGDQDPFERRGLVEVAGFLCPVVYLSLFDEFQVHRYLEKRFPGDAKTIKLAASIIRGMHTLKFRPMLLSHIDEILESKNTDWNPFSLYQALVSAWLNRERAKMLEGRKPKEVPTLSDLNRACKLLARLMFKSNSRTISIDIIKNAISFDSELGYIEEIDIAGRSLLNKNSEGEFRFAHFSIQEFLFSQVIFQGMTKVYKRGEYKPTAQVIQFLDFQVRKLNVEQRKLLKLDSLDLSGIRLRDVDWRNLDLSNVHLYDSTISHVQASEGNFDGAEIVDTQFVNCDSRSATFEKAEMKGTTWRTSQLTGCNFSLATMSGGAFSDCGAENCDFGSADIKQLKFISCSFKASTLKAAKFQVVSFEKCDFSSVNLDEATLKGCTFFECDLSTAKLSQRTADANTLTNCKLPPGITIKAKLIHRARKIE